MNDIKFFDKPECPFCWRIRIILSHLKLPWECLVHDTPENEAVWKALTPFSTVPVIQIDGDLVLADSAVVIEYFHELYPGQIWIGSVDERAKARTTARYADEKIGTAIREVIFEKRGRSEKEWDLQRIEKGTVNFESALPFLEELLADSTWFGLGDQPSMPDFTMACRFSLAAAYGIKLSNKYPNLRRWFGQILEHPAVINSAPPIVSEWLEMHQIS